MAIHIGMKSIGVCLALVNNEYVAKYVARQQDQEAATPLATGLARLLDTLAAVP